MTRHFKHSQDEKDSSYHIIDSKEIFALAEALRDKGYRLVAVEGKEPAGGGWNLEGLDRADGIAVVLGRYADETIVFLDVDVKTDDKQLARELAERVLFFVRDVFLSWGILEFPVLATPSGGFQIPVRVKGDLSLFPADDVLFLKVPDNNGKEVEVKIELRGIKTGYSVVYGPGRMWINCNAAGLGAEPLEVLENGKPVWERSPVLSRLELGILVTCLFLRPYWEEDRRHCLSMALGALAYRSISEQSDIAEKLAGAIRVLAREAADSEVEDRVRAILDNVSEKRHVILRERGQRIAYTHWVLKAFTGNRTLAREVKRKLEGYFSIDNPSVVRETGTAILICEGGVIYAVANRRTWQVVSLRDVRVYRDPATGELLVWLPPAPGEAYASILSLTDAIDALYERGFTGKIARQDFANFLREVFEALPAEVAPFAPYLSYKDKDPRVLVSLPDVHEVFNIEDDKIKERLRFALRFLAGLEQEELGSLTLHQIAMIAAGFGLYFAPVFAQDAGRYPVLLAFGHFRSGKTRARWIIEDAFAFIPEYLKLPYELFTGKAGKSTTIGLYRLATVYWGPPVIKEEADLETESPKDARQLFAASRVKAKGAKEGEVVVTHPRRAFGWISNDRPDIRNFADADRVISIHFSGRVFSRSSGLKLTHDLKLAFSALGYFFLKRVSGEKLYALFPDDSVRYFIVFPMRVFAALAEEIGEHDAAERFKTLLKEILRHGIGETLAEYEAEKLEQLAFTLLSLVEAETESEDGSISYHCRGIPLELRGKVVFRNTHCPIAPETIGYFVVTNSACRAFGLENIFYVKKLLSLPDTAVLSWVSIPIGGRRRQRARYALIVPVPVLEAFLEGLQAPPA